jgi:Outer membrane cobalamin receptor protein
MRWNKKKLLAVAVSFCCWSQGAYAEDVEDAEADVTVLPTIVVTASRVPQSVMATPMAVTVLKPEDWQAKGANNLAEALVGVPGVVVQGHGGASGNTLVKINGTERIVVLVDGKRLNMPQGLASGAGTFDLRDLGLGESVERIEIVRGGGSALYGSDAVGGVVQVFTRKGQGKAQSSITLAGGDDEKFKMNLMTSGSSGKDHWRVSTDYFATSGQRENAYNREGNLSLRYDHDINKDSSIFMTFDHVKRRNGAPGTNASPMLDDYNRTKTDTIGLGYSHKNMKIQAYQISKDATGYSWGDLDHKNRTQTLEYTDSRNLGKRHELAWGGQLKWDRVDSSNYSRVENTHSESLFVQDNIKLGDKVILSPGLRYEQNSAYGDEWVPKIGIVYQAQEKLSFYGNWGRVFKAPNFDDLYWYDAWGSMLGNPNLRPETGWTSEVGFKYQVNKDHFVSGTFFHRELNDAIRWIDPMGIWVYEATNVDSLRTQGFTLGWNGNFGKSFSADVNYTYQDTNATLNYNEGRHQFHTGLHYRQGKWRQSVLVDAISKTGNGLGAVNGVGGWGTLSLSTQYQINEKNKVFLTVYNVFDKEYQRVKNYPEDGRSFLVGWKMDF